MHAATVLGLKPFSSGIGLLEEVALALSHHMDSKKALPAAICKLWQNKNKDERETKTIRKTCWIENSNPSLLKRRGLRCIY